LDISELPKSQKAAPKTPSPVKPLDTTRQDAMMLTYTRLTRQPASEDPIMDTIKNDLERIKKEINQQLEETQAEIEKISASVGSKGRNSAAADGGSLMDNTSQCAYACPSCLRSCCLTQGHYSNHQCSEGHTWL
jgi:hypothetical protein